MTNFHPHACHSQEKSVTQALIQKDIDLLRSVSFVDTSFSFGALSEHIVAQSTVSTFTTSPPTHRDDLAFLGVYRS